MASTPPKYGNPFLKNLQDMDDRELNHAMYLFYGSFKDTYQARIEHLKSAGGAHQNQKIAQLNTTMVKYITPFMAAESNHRLFSRANRIALTMGGMSIGLALVSLGITFYTTFQNTRDTRNQGRIVESNLEAFRQAQNAQLEAMNALTSELRKLQESAQKTAVPPVSAPASPAGDPARTTRPVPRKRGP